MEVTLWWVGKRKGISLFYASGTSDCRGFEATAGITFVNSTHYPFFLTLHVNLLLTFF